MPLDLPLLDDLANRYLARLWPMRIAALAHFVVARPTQKETFHAEPLVSVVVPARNEAVNIAAVFERTPEIGRGTELVFVEGNSTDDTYDVIQREMARPVTQPNRARQGRCCAPRVCPCAWGCPDDPGRRFDRRPGRPSALLSSLAIWQGRIHQWHTAALSDGKAGDALLNLVGNKFFSLAFSWLIGQSVKDTLCGTKVLLKSDYERISAKRAYFGDFDLLFGAAKLNLKIVDLPIRYRERTYGTTNISRW